MASPKGFLTLHSGRLRGKRIPVPRDGSVRPTTDRARERALGLIEAHFRHRDGRLRWSGARVLDAFAGSGALGLEALGKGAGQLWLWDHAPAQVSALRHLLASLNAEGATVAQQSALAPPPAPQAMDLIFLDPPYGKGLVPAALAALKAAGWLDAPTLVYAETEAAAPPPAEDFTVLAQRASASSCLRLVALEVERRSF